MGKQVSGWILDILGGNYIMFIIFYLHVLQYTVWPAKLCKIQIIIKYA